ncbi:hypothetical protein ACFL27_28720, partial [candidate division CSSED10-310 bacterium]
WQPIPVAPLNPAAFFTVIGSKILIREIILIWPGAVLILLLRKILLPSKDLKNANESVHDTD